ncbi:winged helix-turn-helix transcriptional regulator [Promethearchaeum syntrophicum]|uniref:Winged helix-turn-helix transcriptional regulator n=1 Tax=Promethearchaeum syntrophicum TaxID=2594042 RepID=A0A5B9DEY5_9ARCH|nr:winged helix-turn-helix transcriptional regulator [Candidatus Prometheoarchaeum syntrophicum]QEE17350.1 Helix-turn-helix domain protein [Candidatus Prometheoarchaeum syntrophicum]
MKKIPYLSVFIMFSLLLMSSLQILNLENQETNIFDSENFLKEILSLDQFEDITQENREDIRSADGEEEEPENEPDEDEDEDGIDDETEDLNEREVDVKYSENEAHIESTLHQGEVKDKISIEIQTEDEGLKINLEYSKDTESSELEVEFEIVFSTLIEFIDNNNDSIFTENQDTLLNETSLDSFNDFQYSNYTIKNTSKMHYFQISTTNDNLIFHIFFVEEYYELNDILLIPTQMKIDIEIANYTYSDSSSQLSLVMDIESENEFDEDDETEDDETEDEANGYSQNEEWIQTSPADISGFFSWSQYALVDDIEKNVSVNTISISEENLQRVYLNYPRGAHIYHDPKIGVKGIIRLPTVPFSPGNPFSYLIYILLGVLLLFGLIMTKQEYRHYLLNRIIDIDKGVHRLTMEDVLENEFRNQILNLIIENPGIHYSELLRSVDTSSSNLAWHLDILETYKIISKKRVGRFLIFYPFIEKNPFAEFDINLIKSKTTLDIFQIVGDNPGIVQYQIAKRMDLNRKTIKYHLDKLMSSNLIRIEKIGRKNHIYPLE